MQDRHSQRAATPPRSAFFLVGPTATGKSSVAHRIAEREGWWILSADSMLIYRGMNIGTDKPTDAQRAGVRYFGVDLIEPQETFNVGRFMEHAARAFEEAARDGRPMVVVGGTGLYVKCLTEGLGPGPGADAGVRERAEQALRDGGVGALQKLARQADPEGYEQLSDQTNPRRLVRVLERAGHDGPGERTWGGVPAVPLIGLRLEPKVLDERIRARVLRMYGGGLLEEVRGLRDGMRELSATARQAIGYAEALAVLAGDLRQDEAIQRTITRTRQLAKRQMTWFRHQARVEWVDVGQDEQVEEIAGKVLRQWRECGPTPVNARP